MFTAITFGIGFLGLCVLFACKSLEMNRNVQTPLTALRRVDPALAENAMRCGVLCRLSGRLFVAACIGAVHRLKREFVAFFDNVMHTLAARINRYLRGRRLTMRVRQEDVSTHLKNVLERENKTNS